MRERENNLSSIANMQTRDVVSFVSSINQLPSLPFLSLSQISNINTKIQDPAQSSSTLSFHGPLGKKKNPPKRGERGRD